MSQPNWDWIKKAKLLLGDDFVTWRWFDNRHQVENDKVFAYWRSWFPNEHGVLLQFYDTEPVEITDPLASLAGLDALYHVKKQNQLESEDYAQRIKSLSLPSLRRQREMWEELQNRKMWEIPNVDLRFAPIDILSRQIEETIADSIQAGEKQISEETIKADAITRKAYIKRCREECKRLKLTKGETISLKGKYEIAEAIKLDKLGSFKSFRSGAKAYHRISRILSEIGYSNKPRKVRK
jgi:hypothetical protein